MLQRDASALHEALEAICFAASLLDSCNRDGERSADVGLHMPLSHSRERKLSMFVCVCVCVHDPQPLITFCSIASDAIAAAAFGDWRMRLKNFVQL